MAAKHGVYPEYKDSGIEWLGKVPTGWHSTKIKFGYQVTLGKMLQKESKAFGEVLKPYLKAINIQVNGVQVNDIETMWFSPAEIKSLRLKKGDVLISEGGDVGRAAIWNEELPECYIQNAINRARPLKRQNPKFLYYWMRMLKNSGFIEILCNKATIAHYTAEKLESSPLFIPPVNEAEKIANFLDHETAKIDTLIEKQQQLIKLLKEKRQTVISLAVTKGLNPDAPMHDSGVEWLGEVPAHWQVVPLKRVCEVKDGTHDTPQYVDRTEDSFPLVTSKDFIEDTISFDNAKYISREDHLEIIKRSNTELGDVLMSMIGGNIGKALIVKSSDSFSIKNVALFKTRRDENLAQYILYYLQSGLLDVQISLLSRGGAQGFLSLGDIRNLVFLKIQGDEIIDIVCELRKRIVKFDNLIEKAESAINLMQERRTALISAAVTGKIDVRNWQAPSQTTNQKIAA